MNILVTGGSGFLGRNICESLTRKFTVYCPGRAELDLTDDVSTQSYFKHHDIDVVINGAWKPGHRNATDISNLVYTNTRIFMNLVRNKHRFRKLINLGSGAVYDMRYYAPKMKELYYDAHVPVDDTGFTKYVYNKQIELLDGFVDLRLFGVFGKYEDYAIRFISNAICKSLFDLPITLRQNRIFDYLFVDDLLPILEHFIIHDAAHKSYNATPDHSIDLLSLAEMVRDNSGKELPILVAADGMGPEYSGDNNRLRAEISDLKFTPIQSSVEQLYAWYSDHKHLIDRDVLLVDK